MLSDYKITQEESSANGVVSAPDVLTGTAQENKAIFDKLTNQVVITKHNGLIDELATSGAGDTGIENIEGLVATTVQEALEEIKENVDNVLDPTDNETAGKLGFTPFPNVNATNVQDAVEEVQHNLEEAVAGIQQDIPTASEIPSDPFPGVASDNVQGALEELGEKIDDIQAGVIPSGSITGDMIQDGAVTADKLGSDVTGDTIPTSASDPTSISSQLSKFVTATPQEGYNLPLSDGISVQDGLTAIYSKNQFGQVVVHGNLAGQMQKNSVIATLPAGFRPIYTLEMPATCDFTAGRIQVNSAGEISVKSQLSECSSLYFLAVFVAGG